MSGMHKSPCLLITMDNKAYLGVGYVDANGFAHFSGGIKAAHHVTPIDDTIFGPAFVREFRLLGTKRVQP